MPKVLIFRIGSLGDTLICVPALWAVREHFPDAHIAMLCDNQQGKNYVRPVDLLEGAGVVDEFINYTVSDSAGLVGRLSTMVGLAMKLRRRAFDVLVYLPPTIRSPLQVQRDRSFFKFAGMHTILGMDAFLASPPRDLTSPMPMQPSEADVLLRRLAVSGIKIPPPTKGKTQLGIGDAEDRVVRTWLMTQPSDGGRPWIAVGPGSKMPAKQWPAERYRDVVKTLIERFDIWPVIFGGTEDRSLGDTLLRDWNRGYNAAGTLGLRPSFAALHRCKLYLGNDTGTMHMAAFAGTTCVAIFSSRDFPGSWYPYGSGHVVFRTPIDCEGCYLIECIERKMECIKSIQQRDVLDACSHILSTSLTRT